MAAYAALVSLLNNILAIMKHPTLSTSLDHQPIQPLLEKIDFLLDFMEGNNYRGGSEEAQLLERQIAAATHAAEDLIESHIVDLIEAKGDLVCSLDLKQSIQDMDAVMEKATEVKKKREVKEEKSTHLAVAWPLKEEGESSMVGLDAELNHLLDDLTGYQSSRRIISIVAMGGAGKSTLAKNVYENVLIKEHFQFHAWATISEQHNAQEVLSQLLSIRGEMSNTAVDDLGLQLHKTLFSRRYLIVLDDIWSVKAWDEVKRFFPDNNNASRILLTTRLSNVAKDCGSSLFMMNLLDEANSWKLFLEKAFPHEDCPPELREAGEEIVKLCKGLPLSIVVMGGLLLKSPKSVGYWKSVAEDLKSTLNSKEKQKSLDVLSLSYYHLPPHLKPCFLYMGVFKEDYEIPVSEIVNLWVAEGFIKPKGSRALKEIGEGYINDLIDRNLILVVRHQKNGKLGVCRIHDLLRELCIKFAVHEKFFHLDEVRGTERRVVCDGYIEGREVTFPLPLTRSIIMTRGSIKPSPQCRLLRVSTALDSNSPTDYANVNLRYVVASTEVSAVKGSFAMWKLPPSVKLSWNLQTLTIRNRSSLPVTLPPDFWNLRQLRHVECHFMYIHDPPQSNREDGMLENLHTLKKVVNLNLSEEVCKFIPNIKELHLYYYDDVPGYDFNVIENLCNLDRLHKLESLKLSRNQQLWSFYTRELVKKLTSSFPKSLTKLSLHCYELEWDDMTMIGLLPQLEVLKLNIISFVNERKRWNPVDEQFLRLKYLKIHNCPLACWDADASHFPVLEKLHLDSLWSLEEIPLGIGDIPTLQLICVNSGSVSAAISAVRINEDQLDNSNQLQVQLRMCDYQLEDFNQMLETEGLTISNIHLKIL